MIRGLDRLDRRLLIVDDDDALRSMLTWAFEDLGYQVTAVHSCAAARALVGRQGFDFALVDYQLPDGTGDEVLLALRGVDPFPPVLMMSGAWTNQGQADARAAGALETYSKPLDIHELDQRFRYSRAA